MAIRLTPKTSNRTAITMSLSAASSPRAHRAASWQPHRQAGSRPLGRRSCDRWHDKGRHRDDHVRGREGQRARTREALSHRRPIPSHLDTTARPTTTLARRAQAARTFQPSGLDRRPAIDPTRGLLLRCALDRPKQPRMPLNIGGSASQTDRPPVRSAADSFALAPTCEACTPGPEAQKRRAGSAGHLRRIPSLLLSRDRAIGLPGNRHRWTTDPVHDRTRRRRL